ncbi:Vacuolar sorting-associated 16 [Chlorella sorokiniana]|uniref:Protein VACUOLELESS1 n=1 Tax=Chlorella sorokiniana TaxID=3076 RepID=A0A2P6TB41_CHLSO|nr:Vacuolar sorting-associated 16 [Chlorella sorokiniana]|eukprot:PRW05770.1 Vacuolar sorting-associated 16 [Chlorella sorokiniana]
MAADEGVLDPLEDWQLVGEAYFSRRQLYELDWGGGAGGSGSGSGGMNLAFMRVFPAPSGGPVAALRDDSKVVLFVGGFTKPDIQLFSAAGHPLGRVLWDSRARVVAAGWTRGEQLLVVDDAAQVHSFNVRGERQPLRFSLGAECEAAGVEAAAVFQDGLAVLTPGGQLWCVPDVHEPRLQRFPDPAPGLAAAAGSGAGSSCVHCMTVLPPSLSSSGALEVIVAVEETVRVIDANEALPTSVFEGPILRLAASPCGRLVAGYGQDGTIHIWTADLSEVVTRVGLSETELDLVDSLGAEALPDTLPDQLVWCGSDAVLLFWESVGGLLVTLDGAWRWWDLGGGSAAAFATEVDGVRVLSSDRHLLLRRVPPAAASCLEIGSTSPGALLYDARRLFDAQDARATGELLDLVRSGELAGAVDDCLAAAAAELDPLKQAALLKASCYGRAFRQLEPPAAAAQQQQQAEAAGSSAVGSDPRRQVVEVARRLRVLNALREPAIGIPLTMRQLAAEGLPSLVARLVGRRHYLLAMRICQALGLSTEEVLVRWACDKISAAAATQPDDQLMDALQAKLAGQAGVKYAAVASHAAAEGRHGLAALLLEHERVAAEQVPLLLDLGEDERALDKAVESGDSDLVFRVVHTMWRRLERTTAAAAAAGSSGRPGSVGSAAQSRFWQAVARKPAALAFFSKYYRQQDPQLLLELYEAMGQQEAAAELHLQAALEMAAGGKATETSVQRELARAKDAFTRSTDTHQGRDRRWEAAAVQTMARLREQQLELQASSRREGFLGLSVADTIRQCLRLGLKDAATKLAREFKVPDRQFTLLSAQVLAAQHDWPALQALAGRAAGDRKLGLTMEHFIAAARTHGAPPEAQRWMIDRISGQGALTKKAQYYAELGMPAQARLLAEQADAAGGSGAGMLGSLRGAVGGTVGSLVSRMQGERG